jgi:hypothetical protein
MTSLIKRTKQVQIEGFDPNELSELPDDEIEALVFCGEPLVFTAGSAEILGEFRLQPNRLIVELGHIDGGGEGVLPTLGVLVSRFAKRKGVAQVEWIVHAVSCASPNLKLRRVLTKRGFQIEELPGIGEVYHLAVDV